MADAIKQQQLTLFPSVFDYGSLALRGARFGDLVNANSRGSGVNIGFHWNDGRYDVNVGAGDARDGEVIRTFEFQHGPTLMSGVLAGKSGSTTYEVVTSVDDTPTEIAFNRLKPLGSPTRADVSELSSTLAGKLDRFASQVHWIGSVRRTPPRYFEFGPGVDTAIRPDGGGVAEALRASFLNEDGVAEAVSRWLTTASGAELVYAATDEQIIGGRTMVPFQLRVSEAGDFQVAVTDLGEGISQALPVVTLCHQARLGTLGGSPILALEQPELHLHPSATVSLADEIVACVAAGSTARHVIETHSESFLLSLQIALVHGKLKPSDVVVYWVASDGEGSSLERIDFDKEGYPTSGWPAGVFRETLDQARKLSKLRLS